MRSVCNVAILTCTSFTGLSQMKGDRKNGTDILWYIRFVEHLGWVCSCAWGALWVILPSCTSFNKYISNFMLLPLPEYATQQCRRDDVGSISNNQPIIFISVNFVTCRWIKVEPSLKWALIWTPWPSLADWFLKRLMFDEVPSPQLEHIVGSLR